MPGLLRWSARRLRSARCGRRRGPAVPPPVAALRGGRAVPGGASLVAGLPLARLRAARGGRLSARLRARPAPVGRGRGFPGAPVVLGRAAPLRASLPRACCPPSAPAPGGRGRRLRRRFKARPPGAKGAFLGGALRVVGFAHPPPVPRPPGRGKRRVTNPLRRGFWPFGPDFRRKVGNHG